MHSTGVVLFFSTSYFLCLVEGTNEIREKRKKKGTERRNNVMKHQDGEPGGENELFPPETT